MLLCFSFRVIPVAAAVCNPHTPWSSSPDDDDVSAFCMCIAYVYTRLSLLLLQTGQLPGLHVLPPAVQSKGTNSMPGYLLMPTGSTARDVCVCVFVIEVRKWQRGTTREEERTELAVAKPCLVWKEHISYLIRLDFEKACIFNILKVKSTLKDNWDWKATTNTKNSFSSKQTYIISWWINENTDWAPLGTVFLLQSLFELLVNSKNMLNLGSWTQ